MMRDYLNIPEEVEGVGKIYPVSLLEWEEFSKLAHQYLLFSYDMLKYKFKIEQDIHMIDFLFVVALSFETENERIEQILNIQRLFSIVLKRDVLAFCNPATGLWLLKTEGGGVIDQSNFDKVKQIILRQNLLFEPLIANNDMGQQIIDDAIKRMSHQGETVDIESMIAVVSVMKSMDAQSLSQYSYYQLRADYEIAQRIENNRIVHLYRAQGAKEEPTNLTAPLTIHENPYGFDKLFNKVDMEKEKKFQKMLS